MRAELHEMEFFVEVVRQGSITKAAEHLHILKSTGSQWIKMLEKRLGVQLLKRTTRHVILTDLGRAYYERCVRILEEVELAEEMIGEESRTPKGKLKIALPTALATIYFTKWITEFITTYPEIQVDILTGLGVRMIDMVNDNFDVWIKLGPVPDSSLIIRRLGEMTGSIYASAGYLATHPEPKTPEDLRHHNFLRVIDQPYPPAGWTLTRGRQSVKPNVKGNVAVGNMSILAKFVEYGLGVSLIPDIYVKEEVSQGKLVRLLPEWSAGSLDINILMPQRELLPAKTRYFVDFIADKFSAINQNEDEGLIWCTLPGPGQAPREKTG